VKILITGAGGFIGSFLVEKALSQNMEVWAGIRSSSSREYLQDKRIRFIDLHYENKEKLKQQLVDFASKNGKFDYVIHNAGVTRTLHVKDFDTVNFGNTQHLVEALMETGNTPRKFLLMSSLSAYGTGDEKNFTPFKLSDAPKPNTAYGRSKLKAEQTLTSLPDFPYMILRPTGVYGPREKDYLMMLKTVRAGWDISAGFTPQHLTFIYVKDLVDAAFLALESPLVNKHYFVADGDVYSCKEYTRLVKDVLGKKRVLSIKIPLWLLKCISIAAEELSKLTGKPSTLNSDKYKIMSQRNWVCDIGPLVNELGFAPKYKLIDGLKESVEWYKQNKWM
jgi:nucleoside-diphosphate-sugar epimerase